MIQIGKTFVCDASRELGKIYKHLDSLPDAEDDESGLLKNAKGHLDYHKRRIIVISAVGFFEQEIYKIIKETYKTKNNPTLTPFIKSITRRRYYHLFKFDSNNINTFYSFFGEKFKEWCQKKEAEDDMSEFVKNFMLLNKLRNRLAHEGYDHNIEHNSEYLYKIFKNACKMLNWLSESLKEFEKTENRRS